MVNRKAYKEQRNNTWSRGSGRGFGCGGSTPTNTNTVDVITLSTTGNAADYGDLATIQGAAPGYGSTTRGISHAGEGAPGYINNITYFNFHHKVMVLTLEIQHKAVGLVLDIQITREV